MNRREFFDRHAPGWQSPTGSDMQARLGRVVTEAGVKSGDRVLDVGTGTGVLLPYLTEAVGPNGFVLAFDLSLAMLLEAKAKAGSRVGLVQADAHDVPALPGLFDSVIVNAAFPHFEDPARALKQLLAALRPGGAFVVSHPIGRAAVNARHREAGGPVGKDRVPPCNIMDTLLRDVGFNVNTLIDEPEFYLARAQRPPE
ncbi:MAG: class I SAM-dependent methyltransferase [Armatimonadetes bacterium]|nr:class I SAM-dependent methyltransferase [Armatimonadota bacterium]